MNVCPHPFQSITHGFEATRGNPAVCQVCGGTVRECPHCKSQIRSAARFCGQCGGAIPPKRSDAVLFSPGLLREGMEAATARGLTLGRSLRLDAGETPLFWRSSVGGGLVFSRQDAGGVVRLDFLERGSVFQGRGRMLAADLPSAESWLCAPAVSANGVFIATARSVEGLRAHGGERAYERFSWSPPSGTTIRAAAGDEDGLLVMATDANGRITLLEGNGQGDGWRAFASLTGLVAAEGGAWIGALPGTTLVWVAVAGDLVVVDRARPAVVQRHRLAEVTAVDPQWTARARRNLFEPFSPVVAEGGAVALPIPTDNGCLAVLVRLSEKEAQVRPIARLPARGWIAPYTAEEAGGLLLRDEEGILLHDGVRQCWRLDPFLSSDTAPVIAGTWMCILLARQGAAAHAANQGAEVVFLQRRQAGDVAPQRHVGMILEGHPHRGFPPLLLGGTLLLATQASGGRDIRIFPVEIAETVASGSVV